MLFPLFAKAQDPARSISFQALDSMHQVEKRPVIVFLYTDWCRYCKGMEKSIFSDSKVKEELESDFYFVRLNGEGKEDIRFRNVNFHFLSNGSNEGVHELAKALGTVNGTLSYPTITVLNEKLEIVYTKDGFMTKREFLKLLVLVKQQ